MRFAGLLVCITLLFSICIMPVSADKADEGWEKYFFVSNNSSDIKLLKEYLDWGEFGELEKIEEDLKPYNAELDFSKVYIAYGFNYSFPYSDNEDYEYSSEKTNYDGVPDYFQIRSVCVPAYSGNELKCSTDFMILYPLYSPPVTIYNGKKTMFEYMGLSDGAEPIQKCFAGAENAYEAAKLSGVDINQIMVSWTNSGRLYIITTDGAEGGYIYIDLNDVYDPAYGQMYTFEEFTNGLARGDWPTPEPTPTPTPTPRPSRTAAVTPRPTVVTPTATPSAGGTAAPALTATASLFPSSSSAPEQSAGSTVLIVIGAALVIAAAGAAGWAVFRKKKGKE